MSTIDKVLPVEVVFHPSWWHENCGIEFNKEFFFDPSLRVECERMMEQYLYDRFGDIGLGEKDAVPRPVVGPVHLAAGFITSMLLGCDVMFHKNASPDVISRNMSDEEVMALTVPDISKSFPTNELIRMMDILEEKYGYLEGDCDWSGIQNVALDLRGQQLFIDYFENPHIVRHLFGIISNTLLEFAKYMLKRTGTTSWSVNPSTKNFNPPINLHSNCSVTMISPKFYDDYLYEYEYYLSQNLQPYGIHHCGDNMHVLADSYSRVKGVSFFDVGWGSDVKICREKLQNSFLNLRLSPVKLMGCSTIEVEQDILNFIEANGGINKMGLCCINMDYGIPDENIREIFHTAERLREKAN